MKYLNLLRHRFVRIYQSYFPQPLTQQEHAFLAENLSDNLQSLFYAQPLCDQRHGLLVYDKCLAIFDSVLDAPSKHELLVASCFHDLAKKDCRFNVSQRVLVATLLAVIPARSHSGLRANKSKCLRRIGIYVDHSELSWEFIKSEIDSDFVREAITYHHGVLAGHETTPNQHNNLELFIKADTL